jgi:hypothetical protein
LLHAELEQETAPPIAQPSTTPPAPETLSRNLEILETKPKPIEPVSIKPDAPSHQDIAQKMLRELAAEPSSTYQSSSNLFQSFLTKCRAAGALGVVMDMDEFQRHFAFALAKLDRLEDAQQDTAKRLAENVDSDILAPYLIILRSALEGKDSPDAGELAAAYGTSSPGRRRRLHDHPETLGLIGIREEYGGGRTLLVPGVEAQTD